MDEPKALLRDAAVDSLARIRRDRTGAPPRIQKILTAIEEHLFERDFNVNELKAATKIRDHATMVRFRACVGESPFGYMQDRRFEIAGRLLAETDLKIWEISELLGYSSLQVFSRAFARWAGERPTVYRSKRAGGKRRKRPPKPASQAAASQVPASPPTAPRPAASRSPEKPSRPRDLTAIRTLNEEIRRARRQNPEEAVRLAHLAVVAADGMPDLAEPLLAERIRAECWLQLAQVCREASDPEGALRAAATAEERLGEGRDELALQVSILTLKAMLEADEGRFGEAAERIEEALGEIRAAGGEDSLMAELLIQKAAILARQEDPDLAAPLEEALVLLRDQISPSARWIDSV